MNSESFREKNAAIALRNSKVGLPPISVCRTWLTSYPRLSASFCCDNFLEVRSSVSSAPIACVNVLLSLFLSAPMALGTAHIHLLDAKLFSDYSHPIEFSEFGRATIAEEVFERADPEMKEISRQSKTESPARWLFVLCWMHITLIVLRCMQIPSL